MPWRLGANRSVPCPMSAKAFVLFVLLFVMLWCGRQLQRERLPRRALRSFSGKSRGRQPPQRARGGPSNVPATRRPFLRRCGAGTRIAAVWVAASARAAAPTEATAAIAAPTPRRRGKMATKRRGGLMCRTSRGESTDFGGALSRRGRKRRRLSSWKPTSVWYTCALRFSSLRFACDHRQASS